MKVPFVDLRTQYLSIKEEIDSAIESVIMDSAFIGGKRIKDFEENFAKYLSAKMLLELETVPMRSLSH